MGAIVNRELKQRIRPVNGITADRQVAKADIKHLAKIVMNFDKRFDLWEEEGEEKKDESKDALVRNFYLNPLVVKTSRETR